MAEKLSIEALSTSERAFLASQSLANYQAQLAESGPIYSVTGSRHLFDERSFGSDKMVQTALLGVGRNLGRSVQSPRQRTPDYRGKVTGHVHVLLSIFDRWQIADKEAVVFLGSDNVEFVNDLRKGSIGLGNRDAKDRARIIMRIYEGVHSLMRSADAERSWIRAPLPALNGRTVLDIMRDGSMSDLIYINQFVDYVNGR
jgi:hypothetical protein